MLGGKRTKCGTCVVRRLLTPIARIAWMHIDAARYHSRPDLLRIANFFHVAHERLEVYVGI